LGGDPLCMGPIGGQTGNFLAELATLDGLSAQWTRVENETRTCTILVHADQDATVVNEPGSTIDTIDCQGLIADVRRAAALVKSVSICGSLPPGFSQGNFKSFLIDLVTMGKQVWVDTSGNALKTALEVNGICMKVNAAELGAALNVNISTFEKASAAAEKMCEHGILQTAITLGKDGAVYCTGAGIWSAQPPDVEIISTVGSGDAFLGGLLFRLQEGASPEEILKTAVAAGVANALEYGGGRFSKEKFNNIRNHVKVIPPN